MAKKAYVYDGSAWQDLSSSIADLSTYQQSARTGLVSIVPTSVSYTGGTAPTIATNGTITWNANTSVTINNCFSSTYDNYMLTYDFDAIADNLLFQMSSNGTPDSSNLYRWSRVYLYGGNAALNNGGSSLDTKGVLMYGGSAGISSGMAQIFNPSRARHTNMTISGTYAAAYGELGYAQHMVNTAYDGIKIYGTGGFTGKIRIYGYNNNA